MSTLKALTGYDIALYKTGGIGGFAPNYHYLTGVGDRAEDYEHTLGAFGGCLSAQFSLKCSLAEAGEWAAHGIGLHVVVQNEYADNIWTGFVNTLTIALAGATLTYGPLTEISNRVRVSYTVTVSSTRPPTGGLRTYTTVVNDLTSQARYGIIAKTLNVEQNPLATAIQSGNYWLAANAQPKLTRTFGLGEGSVPVVTFGCLGYINRLTYPYAQVATTGEINASVKVAAILDADPNALVSSANAIIEANTTLVIAYENGQRQADSLLKAISALGDAAYNRWLFGVYGNMQSRYQAAPTVPAYMQHANDPNQLVRIYGGDQVVMPWNVQPGKWVIFTDFNVAEVAAANLRQNPQAMFVETVTYTAPMGLSLSGGPMDEISQMLARLGLSGASS